MVMISMLVVMPDLHDTVYCKCVVQQSLTITVLECLNG